MAAVFVCVYILHCEALSEERRKLSDYINLEDGW